MANRTARDKRWLAACTVAVATAMGAPAIATPDAQAVQNLRSYCQTSWRNAGIDRQEWPDCTQQAFAELIERISTARLGTAVQELESDERRELNRAVWRIIQRWRRSPRNGRLHEEAATAPVEGEATPGDWNEIVVAARRCLSQRQLHILTMARDGWRVQEIADKLNLPAARVSDEKYKAIKKLREHFA